MIDNVFENIVIFFIYKEVSNPIKSAFDYFTYTNKNGKYIFAYLKTVHFSITNALKISFQKLSLIRQNVFRNYILFSVIVGKMNKLMPLFRISYDQDDYSHAFTF